MEYRTTHETPANQTQKKTTNSSKSFKPVRERMEACFLLLGYACCVNWRNKATLLLSREVQAQLWYSATSTSGTIPEPHQQGREADTGVRWL